MHPRAGRTHLHINPWGKVAVHWFAGRIDCMTHKVIIRPDRVVGTPAN